MKLVIDRNKWLRGEGSESSYLLRESDGKMCCLGFYLQECGLTKQEIGNVMAPHSLDGSALTMVPTWLVKKTGNLLGSGEQALEASPHCGTLMEANDECDSKAVEGVGSDYTADERENKIKHTFALHGVDVEFIN